jgi:hypothetical protein
MPARACRAALGCELALLASLCLKAPCARRDFSDALQPALLQGAEEAVLGRSACASSTSTSPSGSASPSYGFRWSGGGKEEQQACVRGLLHLLRTKGRLVVRACALAGFGGLYRFMACVGKVSSHIHHAVCGPHHADRLPGSLPCACMAGRQTI